MTGRQLNKSDKKEKEKKEGADQPCSAQMPIQKPNKKRIAERHKKKKKGEYSTALNLSRLIRRKMQDTHPTPRLKGASSWGKTPFN